MPETPTVGAQTDSDTPATLDAYYTARRAKAAETRAPGGGVQAVCEWLAERGGHAFLADARLGGHSDDHILAGLKHDPDDGRHRPRLAGDDVAGSPSVWLTGAGWKAVGQPRRGEVKPSTQTLTHSRAPAHLQAWLTSLLGHWAGRMSITVEQSASEIKDFSEACKAAAWGNLKGREDPDGQVGLLTGGLRPDALIVERFPDELMYRWAKKIPDKDAYGSATMVDRDILAETTLALEVEITSKSTKRLEDKVRRLDAALALGRVAGVVWLVRTAAVQRQLRDFGCGESGRRPLHYVVTAGEIGITGGDFMAPSQGYARWWPLGVAETRLTAGTAA
jgi:hypothetical protein